MRSRLLSLVHLNDLHNLIVVQNKVNSRSLEVWDQHWDPMLAVCHKKDQVTEISVIHQSLLTRHKKKVELGLHKILSNFHCKFVILIYTSMDTKYSIALFSSVTQPGAGKTRVFTNSNLSTNLSNLQKNCWRIKLRYILRSTVNLRWTIILPIARGRT